MALPNFNDLTGLDVSFNGEPFCNIATGTGSLDGLDTTYEGEPFSGTKAPSSGGNVVIQPDPGLVTSSGVIAGLSVVLPAAPGEIAASGVCGDIKVVPGNISPDPGMVTAAGFVGGIRQIIPATVGQSDAAGVCGGVVNAAVVITAAPGQTTATGATARLSSMISAPPAQMVCSADISGLLCALTAVPALGFVTGGVAGVKCFSLTSGVKRRYACRIECDGFADIIVPVSAFSSRQRRGYPSYSEITIPGLHRFAEVALRSEGYFVVSVILTKDGEDLLAADIFNTPIDKMTITGNQSFQHMVLSGTRPAEENKGPQTAPLKGVIYRRQSYGELSLRTKVTDLYLKPGDTVTYDGDSFIARTVTHTFSSAGAFMEVREGGE
ncbi:MAG: hypothetical protein Q7U40_06410 [Desulfatirhabdiaceae bacterium]|nr:hypothetical protein [Desulfatirhabdiaceae bacterium]